MQINLSVLSTRLRKAREVLGYSIDQVGAESGVAVERLSAIENGQLKPSGDELLILAALYSCNYMAFVDESLPAPVQQTDILFRRFGDSFTFEDRRAVQEFLCLCETEAELEVALGERKKPFAFSPSGTFYKAHGQQAAEALRTHLGYKENEVRRDIYRGFREIGIHVFRRKLGSADISGLYVEHPIAGHCVLVNYDEDAYRQRFSVCHEVAHAIFDSSDEMMVTFQVSSAKYDKKDLKEFRANSFASHYLMPRSMLEKLPRVDESQARHWAQEFRVSTAALAYAMLEAGLISDQQAQAIKSVRVLKDEKIDPEASDDLSDAQRRRRLLFLERGLSDYYVGLCFEALHRQLISISRAAECLRVDLAELAELAKLYGKTLPHGA